MTNALNTVSITIGKEHSEINTTNPAYNDAIYDALDRYENLPADAFDGNWIEDTVSQIEGETVSMTVYEDGSYEVEHNVSEAMAQYALALAFEIM